MSVALRSALEATLLLQAGSPMPGCLRTRILANPTAKIYGRYRALRRTGTAIPPAAGVRTLHAEESQKFSCNLKNMPAIEEIEKTIKAAPEASEIAF